VALYRELDVALDPLPYGGATTSCEALAMGVPVISLAGQGMVRRLSASVLAAAGLEGWIAENEKQYMAIAKGLAAKGPRQLQQRQTLREGVLNSPLGDGKRLSRELERLYREAAKAAQRC
jgi:predicted O-linked N-acetylglucosamine transferase (SPINDLY family)